MTIVVGRSVKNTAPKVLDQLKYNIRRLYHFKKNHCSFKTCYTREGISCHPVFSKLTLLAKSLIKHRIPNKNTLTKVSLL